MAFKILTLRNGQSSNIQPFTYERARVQILKLSTVHISIIYFSDNLRDNEKNLTKGSCEKKI